MTFEVEDFYNEINFDVAQAKRSMLDDNEATYKANKKKKDDAEKAEKQKKKDAKKNEIK